MISCSGQRNYLPDGLRIRDVVLSENVVVIQAEAAVCQAICPECGRRSKRRHGAYRRRLSDLPAQGHEVWIELNVRRFRCSTRGCHGRTFSERIETSVTAPHARRTSRLQDLVRHLGLALGGRPAQALARRLLLPVSKDTFLRSARQVSIEPGASPRVVGIDDWAWRRGQRYGTLICDLERRKVIDLLPDRDPATVADWLRQHPQIEVVARDRNGGYGRAVSAALPQAVQVADRWHLLQNASDAFLAAVRRKMSQVRKAVGAAVLNPSILTAAERLQFEGFQRRQQTNQMVRRMADEGVPIKRIVRLTGISRGLVRRILRGEREDVFCLRQSSLTPWLPLLEQQWRNGCRNGAELWRRLQIHGFQGSLRVVGEWPTRQRRAEASTPCGESKCPPSRKIARMMTAARDHLSKAEAVMVARIEAAIPSLAATRLLTDRFAAMVRNGDTDALANWLADAERTDLAAFVRGLRADEPAVAAALSQPWSNGQTEGQINRLKTLKRQMYGRASIDLLRARIVHRA